MNEWVRIPLPVESEADRRDLAAILTSIGLDVHVIKERPTEKSAFKRYVEFRLPDA